MYYYEDEAGLVKPIREVISVERRIPTSHHINSLSHQWADIEVYEYISGGIRFFRISGRKK